MAFPHVNTEGIAKVTKSKKVFGADLDTEISVEVELSVDDGAIDQGQVA